ncbi:MAG: ABC transporter substrate-binding protein [Proteobacteria bacterium]|nr:ABC transporter substrate-binding protein [Pseudomonadota bacterium]MBU1709238.1 ABC transporter substrate-binding protein [Pseudomonadota bacterium]
MKKIFFLILSLLFLLSSETSADTGNIFVVQSSRLKPYMEALDGLRYTLRNIPPQKAQKSIQSYTITEFLLTGDWSWKNLQQTIESKQPQLIVAIGTNALAALEPVVDIPIIYLMVPFPESLINGRKNITGIDMKLNPETHLAAILGSLPATKKIGTIYDPRKNSNLVQKIKEIARQYKIELVALKTDDPKKVPQLLSEIAAHIDLFWMLPDLTVLTPETTEQILYFSLENRIPVATFSSKYLKQGAVIAVTFDIFDMGKQAGELAEMIVDGTPAHEISPRPARTTRLQVNHSVAKNLGIEIQELKNND